MLATLALVVGGFSIICLISIAFDRFLDWLDEDHSEQGEWTSLDCPHCKLGIVRKFDDRYFCIDCTNEVILEKGEGR